MALTLTAAAMRSALRLGDTPEETAEVDRLLQYATQAVTRHLGAAFATTPETVANEAAIRIAGYAADQPNAGRGSGWADSLRNSGALAIMAPYRVHRAGVADAAPAPASAPAGLRQIGVEAVSVTTANRWVRTMLPYPSGDIFGVKVGTRPIALGLTVDLPADDVAAGGDATAAIGTQTYALGSDRAIIADRPGGNVFFAASTTGEYTVRLFDHA